MTDLQKLLFDTQATVSDKEILATARLSARVKAFAGSEISDGTRAVEQLSRELREMGAI